MDARHAAPESREVHLSAVESQLGRTMTSPARPGSTIRTPVARIDALRSMSRVLSPAMLNAYAPRGTAAFRTSKRTSD
jgi:hypothetical protein